MMNEKLKNDVKKRIMLITNNNIIPHFSFLIPNLRQHCALVR